MDRAKYRGLRTDGKGFATGFYCNIQNKEHYILEPCALGLSWTEVIPESVGQYTGLKDCNGVEIYKGDKLKRTITFRLVPGQIPSVFYDKVIYSGGGFKTIRIDDEKRGLSPLEHFVGHEIEVIGNIHESEVKNG